MKPTHLATPYRTAILLNGITWAVLGLCLLLFYWLKPDHREILPLLVSLPVAGLGTLVNLLLAAWHGSRGRRYQAWQYLLGFLLLLPCYLWERWLVSTLSANMFHQIGG